LIGGHDLVEGVGDLAGDTNLAARQTHREVAGAHRLQGVQNLLRLEMIVGLGLIAVGPAAPLVEEACPARAAAGGGTVAAAVLVSALGFGPCRMTSLSLYGSQRTPIIQPDL